MSAEDGLIGFNRDIRPILNAKCLECHGPDDAKNDFRVDDADTLLGYVEAGEADASMLWADYLVTDDEDTRMPPPDKLQLTGVELAAIKWWIEEGAKWEDAADSSAVEPEAMPDQPKSFVSRAWTFQGLFHPVSVHLPVALLSISCFFLIISYKLPNASFEAAAFHCLWVGAIGAIGACVMGWAYAQHEGYGEFSFDVIDSLIDRHRWAGIAVAIVAVAMVPLALKVHLKQQTHLRRFWLAGAILLVALVGGTGNWGGELIYGTNHYFNEFKRLFLAEDPSDGEVAHHYFHATDIAHAVVWGYTGDIGPKNWAALSPEYSTTRPGRQQSPIDFKSSFASPFLKIDFQYQPTMHTLAYEGSFTTQPCTERVK